MNIPDNLFSSLVRIAMNRFINRHLAGEGTTVAATVDKGRRNQVFGYNSNPSKHPAFVYPDLGSADSFLLYHW